MYWVLGASALLTIGTFLRRLLGGAYPPAIQFRRLVPLRPELNAVYQPIEQEIDTHAALLRIPLNDAFEERDLNRHEIAWRLVRLSVGEWKRLSDLLIGLLQALSKSLPLASGVVAARRMVPGNFKSTAMVDHIRLYDFLEQLVFSSKLRFKLQLRLLQKATATLTAEFRRTCR